MKMKLIVASFMLVGGIGLPLQSAYAKVSADKAKELDGAKHTCMGAEKAGSPAGVAAFTGKYVGTWPGIKGKEGYEPGPFADEKPLFTISQQNMAQYADKLTEGMKTMLTKYPQSFKMNGYTTH